MKFNTNYENIYRQLGRLVEAMPDLAVCDLKNSEVNLWLGRVYALVDEVADVGDVFTLKTNIDRLHTAARASAVNTIHSIVYRALAITELKSPAGVGGVFIPVGNSFDAFAAISKILTTAKNDVLIIDPYMDGTTLTNFAIAVPENVQLRLLASQKCRTSTLLPAALNWVKQYGIARPLSLRLATSKSLHDRAIFIDDLTTYTLTQSLNAFADRSPGEIIKSEEVASLKIPAYDMIWQASEVIDLNIQQ